MRPRDAGTLILLDDTGPKPMVLMGRRSARVVFMPGKYVFPGGRLETSDLALARDHALSADAAERLLSRTSLRFDARRATAVALATIRETFEEAGIAIGTKGRFETVEAAWSDMAALGVVPNVAALHPVARAITPTGLPRRYDTRFFCASVADIGARLPFAERPDEEFDDLGWFALDALDALDLPGITRQVLLDVAPRLRDRSWRDSRMPMPFYRTLRGRTVREMI